MLDILLLQVTVKVAVQGAHLEAYLEAHPEVHLEVHQAADQGVLLLPPALPLLLLPPELVRADPRLVQTTLKMDWTESKAD